MTTEFRHTFECWAGRGGECRMGCSCSCHPVHLDHNGYVKEPEVEGEDGPSLFDYLEAAYGVERTESLMIGIWQDIQETGGRAARVIAAGPPRTLLSSEEVYDEVNQIESLVDKLEIDLMGGKMYEGERWVEVER